MMQLYVLRYVSEAIGKITRIGLKITNGVVSLLIDGNAFVARGFDAMTDGAPEIKISRD
jgi:hypothetical protein